MTSYHIQLRTPTGRIIIVILKTDTINDAWEEARSIRAEMQRGTTITMIIEEEEYNKLLGLVYTG